MVEQVLNMGKVLVPSPPPGKKLLNGTSKEEEDLDDLLRSFKRKNEGSKGQSSRSLLIRTSLIKRL